jgi:hypothetical protein
VSAAAVRAAFRDQVSGLLVPFGYEFVESINRAETTKTLPDYWYTLDFLPASDNRISLGVPALFRETGRVAVAIFNPQQTQDTAGIDAAEIVRAAMANWFDATGAIRVLTAQPPTDLDGGDFRGSYYGVTVDLLYQFDRMQ